MTSRLLGEVGAPTMVWMLANAFPNKISGTNLNAPGITVAMNSIVMSDEGLKITNA